MFIFTLITEPLLQRLNTEVKGYCLTSYKNRITTPSYADDITVTLAKEEDAERAVEIVEHFGKSSALNINQ